VKFKTQTNLLGLSVTGNMSFYLLTTVSYVCVLIKMTQASCALMLFDLYTHKWCDTRDNLQNTIKNTGDIREEVQVRDVRQTNAKDFLPCCNFLP
jgi:hypothetical protein